jgi:GMP synthase (glutamine-hydrolysing)
MSSGDPAASAARGLDNERVLVLDFGSQYAQLIARRIREQNVYCEVVGHSISADRLLAHKPRGIILSGGPASVYQPGAPRCDPAIYSLGIPLLGICYGMQLICDQLGGCVESSPAREFGRAFCTLDRQAQGDRLLSGVPPTSQVWMSHGDRVTRVSPDFTALAATPTCPLAIVKHRQLPVYGVQFHPEVSQTEAGKVILSNFLRHLCLCTCRWTMGNFADAALGRIRQQVGKGRVICGLSGGVDSAVTAALIFRAVGNQLSCILVDNGLLRLDEKEAVIAEFTRHFQTDLHVVSAEARFLKELEGVTNPQEKRRRIGHAFIECFREEADKIEGVRFLAQGTLYPDVIESGAADDGPAATIKLHHNVGGLPEELGFELVEPLRDLFKDEVRQLGHELGLPDEIVWRHPFPGPGLAVRCLGAVTGERLRVLREADAIVVQEIKAAGLYRSTAQAFAVLLPVQSVGVMGDARTYEDSIVVRCVNSDDFMTADWSHLPHELLARISTRITNEVQGVNRVVYDISSKPPATIEWE